jgi:hypothetical protein
LVKSSTLAVILAALIISVALTAEADGAGLVWRAVNKAGSSIHDISNVTSIGCGLNQYLSVNSSAKWACTTLTTGSNTLLDGSVHTDTVAQTVSRGSIIYGDSTPAWNELIVGGANTFLKSDGTDISWQTISSGFTNITPVSTSANNTLIVSNSSNTAIFKNLAAGVGISIDNGTNTLTIFNTGALVDTDTTNVSSSPQTTATIITDNSTSGVTLKTLEQGTGITLTNGSQKVTITSSITQGFTNITPFNTAGNTLVLSNSSNTAILKNIIGGTGMTVTNNTNDLTLATTITQGFTNITPVSTASNNTLMVSNSSNTMILKNLSAINGTQIDNGTNTLTIMGTYIQVLKVNQTSTANNTDTRVFTIPLTASQGNSVEGVLSATSILTGITPQIAFNVTQSTTKGTCHILTPSSTTADETDNISLLSTGRATNTGAIAWVQAAEEAGSVYFNCSMFAGATPGSLLIWLTSEPFASNTPKTTVMAGSYYIKTP